MIRFLKYFTELIAGIQIAASPFLVGLGIGVMLYAFFPTTFALVTGSIIAGASLVIGIRWAMRVHKHKGTVNFMSRVMATPELDHDHTKGGM